MGKDRIHLGLQVGMLLATLMLAAALAVAPPAAAAPGPTLEVLQVGWDGTVVPGSWSPVRVRVTGGSADANALVEVVLKARYQPGPQAAAIDYPVGAYGQELALPAGVPKEATIWIPMDGNVGGGASGTVRLLATGQTVAEERVEFRTAKTPFWPLVGVLAESPSVARVVSQAELPFQGLPIPLSAARLSAADLPPSSERLSALTAIVVQGNSASTMTGEQRRAVHDWVMDGGHLLLLGGPDASRAAGVLPPGALPVAFGTPEGNADLDGLARWAQVRDNLSREGPIARFQMASGSLLAGTPDRPLAWRLGLGQGTVTLLAADPSLEPLSSWAGTPTLLLKALEPALPSPTENEKMRYIRMEERNNPMRLQGALEALPPEAFPDWRVAALILGGFALVVGPLTHLWLWRTDRRVWVWVAVPAVAVLTSGALYFVGVGRDGRDVVSHVVAHVRLDPETRQAGQTMAVGFFAPTHAALAVNVPGDVPLRTSSRGAGGMFYPGGLPMSPSAEPPFRVVSGRDSRVEFATDQWAMRSIVLTRALGQEAGSISAHMGIEGGVIKGTLVNDTPYPLEDAAVVVGQSLVKLGNLAPGQTAQVVLDPGPAANPFSGGFPLSWRLFGQPPGSVSGGQVGYGAPMPVPPPAVAVSSASYRYVSAIAPGMPDRLELPSDPEVQRRVRLMDALLNQPRVGPGGPAIPLTFLAFTRAPVGSGIPSAGDHPTYYLTLLEQSLSLDLQPGPFSMPAALIPADTLEQTGGMGGGGDGTINWVEVYSGSVTYGFRLPLPGNAKPEVLVISTQQVGSATAMPQGRGPMAPGPSLGPGPAEPGVFSVYNWQKAAWEPLPGGQEQARLAPASPYVGPDRLVKVQVSTATDQMVRFVQPALSVEGTVEP